MIVTPGSIYVLVRERRLRSSPSFLTSGRRIDKGELLMCITGEQPIEEDFWALVLHQSGEVGYILTHTDALMPIIDCEAMP